MTTKTEMGKQKAEIGLCGLCAAPLAERIDLLQGELARLPQVECPLVHRFTPGLYIREIFMPRGAFIISKLHRTEHPYTVSQGRVAVWTEEGGVVEIRAPFTGVTRPGTRRMLLIIEDCVWTTYHPTQETDVDRIEAQIIEPRGALPPLNSAVLKQMTEVASL